MTLIKAMVLVLIAVCILGLWAMMAAKAHADRVELEYWQDRARKEGREKHGKTEEL